ncbi:MAG: hypothetical protein AB1894_26890 [Chloroflexota bacterium]
MKVVYEYSHLGGAEILKIHYPEIEQEIYAVIGKVKAQRHKQSKEKAKMGKLLFSPVDMNRQFHHYCAELGYQELKDTYTIRVPNSQVAIPGGFKQDEAGDR